MLEYGLLLYCYEGNVQNVLEMGADIASTAAIFLLDTARKKLIQISGLLTNV